MKIWFLCKHPIIPSMVLLGAYSSAVTKGQETRKTEATESNADTVKLSDQLGLLTNDALMHLNEKAINESKKMAKNEKVGQRVILGWNLQDVQGDGNCFYAAVVDQLYRLGHDFMEEIPDGTEPYDALRLKVQGKYFKDREWADHPEILKLSRELGVVVAIADTRTPNQFIYHYVDRNNRACHTIEPTRLPAEMPIVKIAYTGDHYLSVQGHPTLRNAQAMLFRPSAGITALSSSSASSASVAVNSQNRKPTPSTSLWGLSKPTSSGVFFSKQSKALNHPHHPPPPSSLDRLSKPKETPQTDDPIDEDEDGGSKPHNTGNH